MDPNNLDKYFSDKLNNRNIPFRAEDWSKMSEFLDKHPVAYKGKFSKRRVLLPLGLLSLLVLGFFLPRNSQIFSLEDKYGSGWVKLKSVHSVTNLEQEIATAIEKNANKNSDFVTIMEEETLSTLNNGENNLSLDLTAMTNDLIPVGSSIENKTLDREFLHKKSSQEISVLEVIKAERILSIEDSFSKEQIVAFQQTEIPNRFPFQVRRGPLFDLFLGMGFMGSPQNPVYRMGISGRAHFGKFYFLRLGMALSSQSTHSHPGYVFEKKRYYLGVNSTFYEMEVEKALSVSVPLDIGIQKGRHSFVSGLELERIVASRGVFTERSQGEERSITLEEGWIVDSDVLPRHWLNYSLGYEYLINPNVSLGFRLERALSNTTYREGDISRNSPLNSIWGRGMVQLRINI